MGQVKTKIKNAMCGGSGSGNTHSSSPVPNGSDADDSASSADEDGPLRRRPLQKTTTTPPTTVVALSADKSSSSSHVVGVAGNLEFAEASQQAPLPPILPVGNDNAAAVALVQRLAEEGGSSTDGSRQISPLNHLAQQQQQRQVQVIRHQFVSGHRVR